MPRKTEVLPDLPRVMITGPRGIRTIELDEELLTDIRELIHEDARAILVNILADLHAADLADLLESLDEEDRQYVLGLLSPQVASEVIPELTEGLRESLVPTLKTETIAQIVSELESDDAADLIAILPDNVATRVLRALSTEDAAKVRHLLRYPEDTAGGIMALEVLTVPRNDTVKTAISKVRRSAKQGFKMHNLYVVDDEDRLVGFLPVGDLVLQGPGRRMSTVMDPQVISVRSDMDQEEVANLMRKYDLVSVPVVSDLGAVIGRITVDDIVDVIQEEATEDIERMAGLAGSEEISTSVFETSRIRLPWLLVGFAGEMLSALVLSSFQASLEEIIAAAFFIPIIMAMGGNAGIQSSAIVVRGLATGEVRMAQTGKRLGKEVGIALLNGVILSMLIFLVSYLWLGDIRFGITVASALLVVVINASLVGASVPLLMDRIKVDPAIATGPFITTTNDALGLLIYFGIMSVLYNT
ncbi:MAG: magnesium transporter [Ignavibacteria bacterium]|nr:magnesium transporter [Ignavibacteria bacterium]